MIATDRFAQIPVEGADALWAWLEVNHGQEASVWIVTWKAQHPGTYVSRDEVLDALIAYGWIDGIRRKLDADRTMQLISPRKQQAWARSYKERAARLIEEGRMRPPGLAQIEASKANGLWHFFDDVDALIVPDDLAASLDASPGARAFFEGTGESYRRNLLRWIKIAKTEATRAKRIAQITEACATGDRIAQM